jgi:hypothetical protein
MFSPTDAAYVMLRTVTSSSLSRDEWMLRFVVNLPYDRSSSCRRRRSRRLSNAATSAATAAAVVVDSRSPPPGGGSSGHFPVVVVDDDDGGGLPPPPPPSSSDAKDRAESRSAPSSSRWSLVPSSGAVVDDELSTRYRRGVSPESDRAYDDDDDSSALAAAMGRMAARTEDDASPTFDGDVHDVMRLASSRAARSGDAAAADDEDALPEGPSSSSSYDDGTGGGGAAAAAAAAAAADGQCGRARIESITHRSSGVRTTPRNFPMAAWLREKGDVSCPAFEFIYIYFSFTLSRFSF